MTVAPGFLALGFGRHHHSSRHRRRQCLYLIRSSDGHSVHRYAQSSKDHQMVRQQIWKQGPTRRTTRGGERGSECWEPGHTHRFCISVISCIHSQKVSSEDNREYSLGCFLLNELEINDLFVIFCLPNCIKLCEVLFWRKSS